MITNPQAQVIAGILPQQENPRWLLGQGLAQLVKGRDDLGVRPGAGSLVRRQAAIALIGFPKPVRQLPLPEQVQQQPSRQKQQGQSAP